MLRQRVFYGSLIAITIIGLMGLDVWLSVQTPAEARVFGLHLLAWMQNGFLSTLILLTFAVLAAEEVTTLIRNAGHRPNRAITLVFAAGLVLGPFVKHNLKNEGFDVEDEAWGMMWITLAMGVAFIWQALRRRAVDATMNVASTVFVTLYAGGLAGFLVKLRMEIGGDEGTWLLLFSMFVVKMTDVGALFCGLIVGRNKLIPWLSPKKTWEGLWGGLATAVVVAIAGGYLLSTFNVLRIDVESSLAFAALLASFGLLMGVFAVAGDLVESMLKRDANVKDSSGRVPGMGGALDLFDSPLMAAPAAWFFWTRILSLGG